MAELAGVSAPTISRFEQAEKDIQVFSVLAILEVLGMVDKRSLSFEELRPSYDSDRMVVLFPGKDRAKQLVCAISREALDDHFQGNRKDPLAVFSANRETIEHVARRKYLGGQLEPDGSVLIRTSDLSLS